ncbi:MAG: quinol oxidase [Magnetospirillum sp.]|nr:MAG: quinol oxidase [Magnetospirillum sp.]
MRDRLASLLLGLVSVGLIGSVFCARGLERTDTVVPSDPADFASSLEAMIAAHGTGREAEGLPVIRPPAGDVYLMAERWRFYPALELEAGRHYRLHVASADVVHSLVLDGRDRLLIPGEVTRVDVVASPELGLPQCAEFCGNGHYKMKGAISVVTPQ